MIPAETEPSLGQLTRRVEIAVLCFSKYKPVILTAAEDSFKQVAWLLDPNTFINNPFLYLCKTIACFPPNSLSKSMTTTSLYNLS